MQQGLIGLITGLLFGIGLAVGGMTDPARVLGFLDILGAWDATLAFVMGAAVVTAAIGYRLVLRREQPFFAKRFTLPNRQDIDKSLVMGAALFGIGWGLIGYCPGPAIASLPAGQPATVGFVLAMVAGMGVTGLLRTR
ncbi:MAG: YeeE/YedE family protein [Halomonadaceae bacterium]|nr:MAG: YeeE/YedE family protein [Halomonadaceae bacterium]